MAFCHRKGRVSGSPPFNNRSDITLAPWEGSRVDLHRNNREDQVLVPPSRDYAEFVVLLDGGADVAR